MKSYLIVPLVVALSGAPAVAVVCDLVLCPNRATQASTGCHDHAAPESGKRMTPRAEDCSHISTVDPYVAPDSRIVLQQETSAGIASMSLVAVRSRRGVDVGSVHAPPSSSPRALLLPLRI